MPGLGVDRIRLYLLGADLRALLLYPKLHFNASSGDLAVPTSTKSIDEQQKCDQNNNQKSSVRWDAVHVISSLLTLKVNSIENKIVKHHLFIIT